MKPKKGQVWANKEGYLGVVMKACSHEVKLLTFKQYSSELHGTIRAYSTFYMPGFLYPGPWDKKIHDVAEDFTYGPHGSKAGQKRNV